MQRYMHEYQVEGDAFAGFAVNAHANALRNPNAMFHIQVTREKYLASPVIAPPIRLLDSSPICDGAAAVVLCKADRIGEVCQPSAPPVRIVGSAVAVDRLSLHDRADILDLRAARRASEKAYRMAGVTPEDIDFFEAHDAFSIMAALSLEAAGFAERGQGVHMSSDGAMLDGKIPISTMGGLKARGHPVGASGVYQIVEATLQLQGLAGDCQVEGAQRGMTQSIGGTGATAVTHILERM
jgi:acetyl-CoA C-acetyltransferase